MMVSAYKPSRCGRFASSGRLASEPEFLLSKRGSIFISNSITPMARMPIRAKVARQPNACPMMRPNGSPNTVAIAEPRDIQPKACCRLPRGATRITSTAVIAQNSAWVSAIITRETSNTGKLHAATDSACPAINTANKISSSLRRSIGANSSISGREESETIHAYTVIIMPVSAADWLKPLPMSVSMATGMNSVVLTTKAAMAKASTRR